MNATEIKPENVRYFFNSKNDFFISFDLNGKHFALSIDKISTEISEHGSLFGKAWVNEEFSYFIEDRKYTKVELLD